MKTKFFIIFTIIVILIIGGLGIFLNRSSFGPSKYDAFAQALKSNGAEFYGAFWCPHCQEQKAEFGTAKKYLPYIECSTADGQGQTQVCKDAKIEGYPSWKFKNGITITSQTEPVVCAIYNKDVKEAAACQNKSSQYYKTWLFPDYGFSIKSPTDPIKEGTTWKFPAEAEASGKLSLDFMAKQINFTLPQ